MPRSDISSLSDDSQSTTSSYDEEEYLLAQKEWEESLEQLQQLVGIVLLPFIGKWLGRRWSHTCAYESYGPVGSSLTAVKCMGDIFGLDSGAHSSLGRLKQDQLVHDACRGMRLGARIIYY